MNRWLLLLPLAGALASCGQGAGMIPLPPNGLPPVADAAVTVRFPAQPCADTYFVLRDEGGVVRSKTPLGAGASCTTLTLAKSDVLSALGATPRVDARTLVPNGAVNVTVSNETARVAALRPAMFKDADRDGTLDAGEELPLMTHDLLVYAESSFTASFETRGPDVRHTWNVAPEFSRVQHYVYLPFGSQLYRRSMTSTQKLRLELHVPTPVTSM